MNTDPKSRMPGDTTTFLSNAWRDVSYFRLAPVHNAIELSHQGFIAPDTPRFEQLLGLFAIFRWYAKPSLLHHLACVFKVRVIS